MSSVARPVQEASPPGKVCLSGLVARIRELGVKKKWAEIFALVRVVPLDDLLVKCKEHAHKVAALDAKKHGDRNKYMSPGMSVTPKPESAFTDLIEALMVGKHSSLSRVLDETLSDPVIANSVGVRRLRRACTAFSDSKSEAEEKLLNIMSRWILNAPSLEHRRTLVHVLLRQSNMQDGYDVVVKLIRALKSIIVSENAQALASAANGPAILDSPRELALGDVALLAFFFWCKLNLPQGRGHRLGHKMLEELRTDGLLRPSLVRLELYGLCVHGALGWTRAAAGDDEESETTAGTVAVAVADAAEQPVRQESLRTPPLAFPEGSLAGLYALLDLACDNGPSSLILRQRFFHGLNAAAASSKNGSKEPLILHFGQHLQKQVELTDSTTPAGPDLNSSLSQPRPLLLGTGVWNCIAEALAAQGKRGESFHVLDSMNAERGLPQARVAFDAVQHSRLEGYDLVAFGPNVHSYIQIANSHRFVSQEVRSRRRAQWPQTMQMLFDRMQSDDVIPDMRLLFNMAEAARELGDFDMVTRVIEKAHEIAQVPRKRALPVGDGDSAGGGDGGGGNGYGNSATWQPHTSLPGANSGRLAPKSSPYIPTLEDFSQIYYYGVAVAANCGRPEDCLVLLLMMVQMDLRISEQTIASVLRCLVEAGSPVHLEEVIRLFGLMPKWHIKRGEVHAACFVEALAKLGRFGDASLGLVHMKTSGKALTPTTYAVVSSSLLQAMAEQCPRSGQGEFTGTVGCGKKPLGADEAVDVAASAMRRVINLLERMGPPNNDYSGPRFFTQRAVKDTAKGFAGFEAKAHPELVRKVWSRFVQSCDKQAVVHFSKYLSPAVTSRLAELK